MPTTLTLVPTAASAVNDGSTVTANGATIVIGGVAPNTHAHLRFDTSAVAATDYVVEATLTAKISAKGAGAALSVHVWGSEFGAAITIADYGLTANAKSPIREQISINSNPILDFTDAVGYVGSQWIPSNCIKPGVGGFSDFELRPEVATAGATNTITIHGPAAATPADKPTLTIVTMTEAEYFDPTNPYAGPALGSESSVCIGRETTEGVAVKANIQIDATNINFNDEPNDLFSAALSSQRSRPVKAAVGGLAVSGSFSLELTPEKCFALFPGVFVRTGTVTNGDGTYTHTFKVAKAKELASYTIVTKKGDHYHVYTGCKLSNFSFSIGLDQVVTVTADIMGLECWHFDGRSAGVDAEYLYQPTLASDSLANGLWSFVDATVKIGGTSLGDAQNFNLSVNNNLTPRRGLNGRREAVSHFAGDSAISVTFDVYFQNQENMRKALGNTGKDFPFKARKSLVFDTVEFVLAREDIKTVLSVLIPKTKYSGTTANVSGGEVILLNLTSNAMYDTATKSNIVVTLTTLEPASVFSAQTDLITVKPAYDKI